MQRPPNSATKDETKSEASIWPHHRSSASLDCKLLWRATLHQTRLTHQLIYSFAHVCYWDKTLYLSACIIWLLGQLDPNELRSDPLFHCEDSSWYGSTIVLCRINWEFFLHGFQILMNLQAGKNLGLIIKTAFAFKSCVKHPFV